MLSIYLAYTTLTSRLTTAIYSHGYMYILSICIAYSVPKVAKVKCGYQCAFCMGKSVTPPTFFRRSIGSPVQLSPTPIGDPVQLFRDP